MDVRETGSDDGTDSGVRVLISETLVHDCVGLRSFIKAQNIHTKLEKYRQRVL